METTSLKHPIRSTTQHLLARWRPLLVLAIGVLACNGLTRAAEEGPWLQEKLKSTFPELYARGREGFGWTLHQRGEWVQLPERLPSACVVLVHGLDEPGKLWMTAGPALETAGFTPVSLSYPNDQPIRDSATFLLVSLQDLKRRGVARVAIVAHSMGGLVSREVLTSPTLDYAGEIDGNTVPEVLALVMVGTPNHGSPLANLRVFAELRDQWMRFIRGEGHLLGGIADGWGEAGEDLTPGSDFLKALNARPNPAGVRFTSIAGIASPMSRNRLKKHVAAWRREAPAPVQESVKYMEQALNTLTEGIGDGAVSLDSTRLEGVSDHVTVAGNHLSMIRNVSASSRRLPPAVPIILERLRTLQMQP